MKRAILVAAVLLLGFTTVASAQWRGLGRAAGKVVDEAGTPMAEVTIRADLPGVGGTTVKTNDKGEWTVSGIAKGDWTITVVKDGMVTVKTKVNVQEMAATNSLKTTLKKAQ
jgi:hypothetical protein